MKQIFEAMIERIAPQRVGDPITQNLVEREIELYGSGPNPYYEVEYWDDLFDSAFPFAMTRETFYRESAVAVFTICRELKVSSFGDTLRSALEERQIRYPLHNEEIAYLLHFEGFVPTPFAYEVGLKAATFPEDHPVISQMVQRLSPHFLDYWKEWEYGESMAGEDLVEQVRAESFDSERQMRELGLTVIKRVMDQIAPQLFYRWINFTYQFREVPNNYDALSYLVFPEA